MPDVLAEAIGAAGIVVDQRSRRQPGLAAFPAAIALRLYHGLEPTLVLVTDLVLFGVVFAINSEV
jgi:hypothetical protein